MLDKQIVSSKQSVCEQQFDITLFGSSSSISTSNGTNLQIYFKRIAHLALRIVP